MNIIELNGLIDLNISPRDGKISSQNLKALSDRMLKNAVVGGAFSQIEPSINNDLQLSLFETLSKNISKTQFFPVLAGVNDEGKLSEIGSLAHRVFAIFIRSDLDKNLLRRIYEYAKMKNKPIICQIIDHELNGGGVANDTEKAYQLGLPVRHQLAERIAVSIIIEMSKYFGVKTLLQGVTDHEALDKVIEAKHKGIAVFLEASVHHLIFNDEQYSNFNNYSKIEPPFQNEDGRKYLVELLKNGEIDMLTSLHHNISESDKSGSFKESKYGVVGLDGILSLYYEKLILTGLISFEQLEKLTSINVASFLNLDIANLPKIYFDISESSFTEILDNRSLLFGQSFKGKVIDLN